jgi:hypothetical protein
MMSVFNYTTGEVVRVGDCIGVDELNGLGAAKTARMIGVFAPNSSEANDHNCAQTGGVLIFRLPMEICSYRLRLMNIRYC